MTNKTVLMVGGGTAGHIYPMFSVAKILEEDGWKVNFVGASERDKKLAGDQYPFFRVSAGKFRRYFDLANFIDLFKIPVGIIQSLIIIARVKPRVVFIKGGYVGVPVAMAAKLAGVPIVLHESDSIMGLANRYVARSAKSICLGFPKNLYPKKIQTKSIYTGVPVRNEFKTLGKPKKNETKVILIIGGSQGAVSLNELMKTILLSLLENFEIYHSTGSKWLHQSYELLASFPPAIASRYHPFEHFGKDLPGIMAQSDIVVSRAGANTIAELSFLRKPAILVPLNGSASDHQRKNAQALKSLEVCEMVEESDGAEAIKQKIIDLIKNESKMEQFKKAIGEFGVSSSDVKIAEAIEKAGER